MIGIKLDGDDEFLDTEPDTAISMKIENPIFGDAERLSPGSFSYPFTLPGGDRSPKNSAKLKHPDVIENNQAYSLQKATLFVGGVPFRRGNLKAKSTDKKKFPSYFTFGLNTISEDFKKAKLRDVLDQQFVISSASITKKLYIKKLNGTDDATIEINGMTYTVDAIGDLSVLIIDHFDNNVGVDGNVWLPYSILHGVSNSPLGMTPLYIEVSLARYVDSGIPGFPAVQHSPDPHAELNVKVPADQLANWSIHAFDMTDYYQEFADFLEDYLTGDYPNDLVRFPVLYNATLHTEAFKTNDIINGVNSAGMIKNDASWGYQNAQPLVVKNFNSIQPFLLLKGVLDKIADEFGFEYEGDFYDDPDVANILIDNSVTLDLPMDYIGESKFLFWRRSFNANELVPDISVVDFLKAIASRYNLAIYYNEITQKVRLKFREPVAKSYAHEDITSISSPIVNIDDNRITGFRMKVKKEDTDLFSQEENFIVGTPEEEHEIKCGRLFVTKSTSVDMGVVTGPYVSRKHEERFNLRVFHYKGVVDNGVFSYPGAGLSGDTINEVLAALYSSHWEYWMQYLKNRLVVKINVTFPLRRLLQFDYELKRRFDRNNYLIKSIDLKITNKAVEVATVELYTQRS